MFSTIAAFFSGLKISKYLFIGLGLAVIIGIAIFTIKHLTSTVVEEATEVGRSEVIIKAQEEGINDVKKANKARESLDRDPTVRNSECLRNARNPQDCPNQ